MWFAVITDYIPSNWQVGSTIFAFFTIAPKAWQALGFWEACYDHDPQALEIYKREAKIIYEEENAL